MIYIEVSKDNLVFANEIRLDQESRCVVIHSTSNRVFNLDGDIEEGSAEELFACLLYEIEIGAKFFKLKDFHYEVK